MRIFAARRVGGRMTMCNTPSMRNRMRRTFSSGSRWMALAWDRTASLTADALADAAFGREAGAR